MNKIQPFLCDWESCSLSWSWFWKQILFCLWGCHRGWTVAVGTESSLGRWVSQTSVTRGKMERTKRPLLVLLRGCTGWARKLLHRCLAHGTWEMLVLHLMNSDIKRNKPAVYNMTVLSRSLPLSNKNTPIMFEILASLNSAVLHKDQSVTPQPQ